MNFFFEGFRPTLNKETICFGTVRKEIHSVGETLRFRYQTSRSCTKRCNHEIQKAELICSAKISISSVKGCQSRKDNAGRWWQRCVTAEPTDFGIGISEVRSLCGVDITGWAASLVTFPGGLACHWRINHLVGGNVMSMFTGGEQTKYCSWVRSQSRPHRVQLSSTKCSLRQNLV